MSERPKLQLENVGDVAVMTVKYVNEVTTKFGAKLVFVGDVQGREAETPLVPDKTADKQLERIGLTRQSAVGETLKFSRSPNPSGKPYWDIALASAADKAPPSKRLTHAEASGGPSIGRMPFDDEGAPPLSDEDNPYADPGPLPPFHKPQPTRGSEVAPEAAQKMARARSYLDLLAWVRTQEPTKGMADEAQQAAAATIWIDWKQAGLVK